MNGKYFWFFYFFSLITVFYGGRQDTLAELSWIYWIQFYFDPFMHQLKMGHPQNLFHMSVTHYV